VILFDWHGTLVDTMFAMYRAMDEMLSMLGRLGLHDRLVAAENSKTEDDMKLVNYVRMHHRLHPKIVAEQKVSRTDLLEVLFGDDEEAKEIAHTAYSQCYRHHYGDIEPFEPGIREVLSQLRRMHIKLGILSNRVREFLLNELDCVENGSWFALFDSVVAGDDVNRLKPAPDPVYRALEEMKIQPGPDVWYMGDSTTDTIAAKNAGVTSIFFNGAKWTKNWIKKIFPGTEVFPHQPDYVVDHFGDLLALARAAIDECSSATDHHFIPYTRRLEPLPAPRIILFDWHATLADTLDAMYGAVDDMLPRLEALGLARRLVDPSHSRNEEDRKLVKYVRRFYKLHPKIKAARKISRTDIFEVLFGKDDEAKRIAHEAFNQCYRDHYGRVEPFESGVRSMLEAVKSMGIVVGVLSNRDREFLLHELNSIESSGWGHLFDTVVAGDDTARRKPAPDPILKALENLGAEPNTHAWYVGDSTTDTTAAKFAGVTSVFFNGAQWSDAWINRIFPGTPRYPHKPDSIVDDFEEFRRLVRMSLPHESPQREAAASSPI
jgi:phosphoglycolate phosphatase